VTRLDIAHRKGYRHFLRGMYQAQGRIEIALERAHVEHLLADWPRRRRLPFLESDLMGIGETFAAPPEETIPELTGAEVWGALYVLESSRLGARALLKQIARRGDTRVLCTTHFLSACEPSLWPSFLHELEANPVASNASALVDSALKTFGIFIGAFALELAGGGATQNPASIRKPSDMSV
jgi:heme oxygenase